MTLKLLSRYMSTDVRVRFAPSPTGHLHLGGLRTALYNFLFARSQKGKFILRLEDTDRTRLVQGAKEQLESDLRWSGLTPDEGPSTGGSFGPYVQSERCEIYKEFVNRLLSAGAAYHCFCSEKRIELLRKDAVRNRLVPKYDNHCRNLSKSDILKKQQSRLQSCVRFKLVPSEPFVDLVYGSTLYEVKDVEGDPIILKTDGWPTYHLANVVDDHLMSISHVIRGVEWLQSTNKHIMIYRALDLEPPTFAHLPLLLNTDGTKLSKRQSDISVASLRENGIFSRALLNYIIQAGGGFPEHTNNNSSLEDLISMFDIRKVNKSSGKLPTDRLTEFNRLEIIRKSEDEREIALLLDDIKQLVQNYYSHKYSVNEMDLSYDHIKRILLWSLPRISSLQDLIKEDMSFLWIIPRNDKLPDGSPEIISLLDELRIELVNLDFEKEIIVKFFRAFANDKNIPFKNITSLIRMSLSGFKQGPGVAEMLVILGKSTVIQRIERARNIISSRS